MGKSKSLGRETEAFDVSSQKLPARCQLFYFTFAKIITNVYSAKDSISARPKIKAS